MAPRRKKAPTPPRTGSGENLGDAELWQRIKESARPLDERARALHGRVVPGSPPQPAPPRGEAGGPAGQKKRAAPPLPAPPPTAALAETAPGKGAGPSAIEHRLARRLSRGAAQVEARLDLHGMRQEEAQQALYDFLRGSQARDRRLVLVITGKGRAGAGEEAGFMPARDAGVLRRALPRWLALPRFAELVVNCSPAHRRDGGEGAWYLRLRKPRG